MDIDRTVLVIEGEDGLRAVMASALARRGYRVLQTGSGAQATGIMATEPLHLIVLGALLQDIDGARWLSAIREKGNWVRVIFLSETPPNLETPGKLEQDLGVAMVLHRLVDPEVLGEQIERLIGRPRLPLKLYRTAEMAEMLAALGASYGRRLPGKLNELAQAIGEACAGPYKLALHERARFLSNRIRGTAGSYGFVSIGAEMRRIVRSLEGLRQQGPAGAAAACLAVEEALAAARSLLAAYNADMPLLANAAGILLAPLPARGPMVCA